MENLILKVDSYKASHYLQYPPGTTAAFSYVESRGGVFKETCFFGLQYWLNKLVKGVSSFDVLQAKTFFQAHGEPFPEEGWNYIVKHHRGRLPVRIKAVAEGTVVPVHNVLATIESTDEKVPWLGSWLETQFLRAIWYPTTVCTVSWQMKQIIRKFLEETAASPETELPFKLHDFGARGVSSGESAALGGAAHLVNFMGSDTVEGILLANHYYNHSMAGYSIPASEHSSITSWGKENEVDAYRNMLKHFAKPGSVVACVSDSYDIYNAVENLWGGSLKEEVVKSGATLVIRPDSGTPEVVVPTVLNLLAKKFGFTTNSKGFKVLNNVRVIQGDGVNYQSIPTILKAVKAEGYSTENVALGMGGGLLQMVNRDTQKFAMKCSSVTVKGQERDVFKDPVTDSGKRSKAGRLMLYKTLQGFKTKREGEALTRDHIPMLHTVFENGEIIKSLTFEEVRARSNGCFV